MIGAISTALSLVSSTTAYIPLPIFLPISGITGVAGCVLGLISTMMSAELPDILEIQLETGSKIHVYLC